MEKGKYMETSNSFSANQGTVFVIDGPMVEVLRNDQPVAYLPFADVLEFANNHPLTSENTKEPPDPVEILRSLADEEHITNVTDK